MQSSRGGRGGKGGAGGWKNVKGGLGAMAAKYGRHNSAAVLEAEMQRKFDSLDGEDRSMPRNHRPSQSIDLSNVQVSTMDTPISSDSVGFKLMLKMGWKQGDGLGRDAQGIVDPIRIEKKDECLGVGTDRQDREIASNTTAERKALESEIQANEDDARRNKRLELVKKEEANREHIQDITEAYRCDLCDKKYKNITEMNIHLDSYDHNHKKRLRDMQQAGRVIIPREERLKKEHARQERLMQQQMKAAAAAVVKSVNEAEQKQGDDDSKADAMPLQVGKRPALSFGFGSAKRKKRR